MAAEAKASEDAKTAQQEAQKAAAAAPTEVTAAERGVADGATAEAWSGEDPGGYYDENGEWVYGHYASDGTTWIGGYWDESGVWVPTVINGYYGEDGQWGNGGYFDENDQWVDDPNAGWEGE